MQRLYTICQKHCKRVRLSFLLCYYRLINQAVSIGLLVFRLSCPVVELATIIAYFGFGKSSFRPCMYSCAGCYCKRHFKVGEHLVKKAARSSGFGSGFSGCGVGLGFGVCGFGILIKSCAFNMASCLLHFSWYIIKSITSKLYHAWDNWTKAICCMCFVVNLHTWGFIFMERAAQAHMLVGFRPYLASTCAIVKRCLISRISIVDNFFIMPIRTQ